MPNSVIVGSQWGDEGKAKVIDYLTEKSDCIIRFQGGANAGHTVVVDGHKFIFHMVPSGIIYPSKVCIIANGVVFDAEQFLAEVDALAQQGIAIAGRLFISDLAHLVLPYHKAIDIAREAQVTETKIGTTGRGIGPAYADKANRIGLRAGDLLDWETFTEKLRSAYIQKKYIIEHVYHRAFDSSVEEIIASYQSMRQRIIPCLCDTAHYIFECYKQGKNLLFEGAQGTMLDIDHGTYPFVTSSNTIAGSVCHGSGIGPSVVDHVIGIVKAYTTRVGNGPFPTELDNELGETLRTKGGEFGATTGRPRRCGWFDSVVLRKAIQVNGFTRMALTKLDVLNSFKEINLCTHYELRGKPIDYFPSHPSDQEKAVPVYETHPGWNTDISACKNFSRLPENAIRYVKRIQELCSGVPILIISVGPERNQTIEVEPLR
jgi:adenylosuccinate synthase